MKKNENVYVVTRNSRRVEDKNYEDKDKAELRAEALVQMLKKWKDPDVQKVRVVHTNAPSKIR